MAHLRVWLDDGGCLYSFLPEYLCMGVGRAFFFGQGNPMGGDFICHCLGVPRHLWMGQ